MEGRGNGTLLNAIETEKNLIAIRNRAEQAAAATKNVATSGTGSSLKHAATPPKMAKRPFSFFFGDTDGKADSPSTSAPRKDESPRTHSPRKPKKTVDKMDASKKNKADIRDAIKSRGESKKQTMINKKRQGVDSGNNAK